jgi:peptidylprolyl isomerase
MRIFFTLLTTLILTLPINAQDAPPVTAPADAVAGPAGLAWNVLTEAATGSSPAGDDFVTLDYTTWNDQGTVIDSTAKHPDVRTFPLSKLFPGLKQSLETMKVGEKRRVWIPAALSPKQSPLVIDVELLEISRPLEAPADVAAPPADASVTKSGLASKVLKAGDGTASPKKNSWVVVHYTGWTTDGKLFDTSVGGGAASFQLNQVIPGWTEGLQLMTPGEKRRFWIPEKLAYKGQKGMPAGMLVFDVELVKFR